MKIRLLLVTVLLAATPMDAQEHQIPVYDVGALLGWEGLEREETLPYHAENIAAQWIFGARSPSGSYVFITRIDNTLARTAFTAAELLGFFTEDGYADLQPEGFRSEVDESQIQGDRAQRVVYSSFRTARLGYEAGQGAGEASVRSVFLPLALWNESRNEYFNWIYVADFRGAATAMADLEAFEHLWGTISLPDGLTLIDIAGFNALRPTLAARSKASGPSTTPTREFSGDETEAETLAQAMLRTLSGQGSAGDERLLRSAQDAHPDTVLAGVLRRIADASTLVWQQEVWERTFTLATAEKRPRLAALFLAESIRREQPELAQGIARDTLERVGDVSVMPCEEVEVLLEGLFQAPPIASWTSEPVRRVFHLGPDPVCTEIGEILHQRGFALPVLEGIAARGRDGLWTPHSETTRPGFALLDSKLIGLAWISKKGKSYWKVREITNLLEILAAFR